MEMLKMGSVNKYTILVCIYGITNTEIDRIYASLTIKKQDAHKRILKKPCP